jgi:DNA-binding response OmpR family regulator
MDVRMPMLDGVAAAAELAARSPVCRVVMLTTFDDEDYVVRALRAFTRPNVRLPPAWVECRRAALVTIGYLAATQ